MNLYRALDKSICEMVHFMCCKGSFALSLTLCPPLTFSGSDMVEAQCQRFEVRSADGETVLFSADEEEISIGTEKLRVTGSVYAKSTTHIVHKMTIIIIFTFFLSLFLLFLEGGRVNVNYC